MLIGIEPVDEIKGMLGAQMVATHNAAMTLALQLKSAEPIREQNSAGNLATKLQRYRGKGHCRATSDPSPC